MPAAAATPSPAEAPRSVGASADAAAVLRARLMHRALARLLDRVPDSRKALPHLAAFEAGLARHGIAAIERVSPRGLSKIHTQLRVLPLDPNDQTVQDLVNLVQTALRRHAAIHVEKPVFDPEATMVITEISHSAFMNALEESKGEGSAPAPGPAVEPNPLLESSLGPRG